MTLTVYTVDIGTVAGHVLIIYRCSLFCTLHIDMTEHTPVSTGRGAMRPPAFLYHHGGSGTQQVQITLGSHWHQQDGHLSKYLLNSHLLNFIDWSKDTRIYQMRTTTLYTSILIKKLGPWDLYLFGTHLVNKNTNVLAKLKI